MGLDPDLPKEDWAEIPVRVAVAVDPNVSSMLTFRPRKSNNRYDIRQQNPYADETERHPAWTAPYGWPSPDPAPASTSEVKALVTSGITIYLARDETGRLLAGFTLGNQVPGSAPAVFGPLFGIPNGLTAGVIDANDTTLEELVAITGTLAGAGGDAELVAGELERRSANSTSLIRTSGGQGIGLTAPQRKALEMAAVAAAEEYFSGKGYSEIEDTGASNPFDLRMRRAGQEYIVEIKGTTSAGEKILLTRGEVDVHREWHPRNFLFILAEMTVSGGPHPAASGGTPKVIEAWWPDDADLAVMTFRYSLPQT